MKIVLRKSLILSLSLAWVVGLTLSAASVSGQNQTSADAREPLYWVAPMDPRYRRDSPGKSPMGMDLVPVYATDGDGDGGGKGAGEGAGVVRISPAVQHNIGVRTARARTGRLSDTITTVAYVKFNEASLWHSYPRVEGWIDELFVDTEGEQVSEGSPLYTIYSPTLVSAQEEYVAALGANNDQLVSSSKARLKALQMPLRDIDELTRDRRIRQTIVIRSPRDGIVSKLAIREGHFVTPGTAILEVAGLDDVWLVAEVYESDIAQVKLGDELLVRFGALPGEIHRAKIDFVSPVLDSESRTLEVRATVPNPRGFLKPNLFAEARVQIESNTRALLVPREALIRTPDQDRVVLVVGDRSFKSVAVVVGRWGDDEVEITDGLGAGDEVVTSAQFLLDSESSMTSDFQRMSIEMPDSDSQMDHGEADHSQMDHGTMDHSEMGDRVPEVDQ